MLQAQQGAQQVVPFICIDYPNKTAINSSTRPTGKISIPPISGVSSRGDVLFKIKGKGRDAYRDWETDRKSVV